MDPLDAFLGRFGSSGGLSAPARLAFARASGFRQALTRRRTVTTVLALDEVTVPYGPASRLLGLDAFPLSLDGPEHLVARARIHDALVASADAHRAGVAAAAALAGERLAPASGRIDVVSVLVDPCLLRWVEAWFGLPPEPGAAPGRDLPDDAPTGQPPGLFELSRLVAHSTFFNPSRPNGTVDVAALEHAARQADAFTTWATPRLATAVEGSLAAVLAAAVDAAGEPAEVAARHLLGLTVGPLALGSWALTLAIADLLARPPGLDDLASPAEAAAAFTAAVSRRPPLPGLPRTNATARSILGEDGLVDLPAGEVLAATRCAAHLDPPTIVGADLAFGSGPHRCLGPDHIAEAAGAILAALARRRPRLPPDAPATVDVGPGPPGYRAWPFPSGLAVNLAPARRSAR